MLVTATELIMVAMDDSEADSTTGGGSAPTLWTGFFSSVANFSAKEIDRS